MKNRIDSIGQELDLLTDTLSRELSNAFITQESRGYFFVEFVFSPGKGQIKKIEISHSLFREMGGIYILCDDDVWRQINNRSSYNDVVIEEVLNGQN